MHCWYSKLCWFLEKTAHLLKWYCLTIFDINIRKNPWGKNSPVHLEFQEHSNGITIGYITKRKHALSCKYFIYTDILNWSDTAWYQAKHLVFTHYSRTWPQHETKEELQVHQHQIRAALCKNKRTTITTSFRTVLRVLLWDSFLSFSALDIIRLHSLFINN